MILSKPELSAFVSAGHIRRSDGVAPTIDFVSIGLHLGNRFVRYKKNLKVVDLPSDLKTEPVKIDSDGFVSFPPGCGLLASTLEIVEMPLDLMGFIQTKGTIARGLVTAHLCDGQIDPGFHGNITLELVNLSSFRYRLKTGTPIAQLFLHKLSTPLSSGYNGRYQMASGPTSMRI
jgi:dCTP deaminase